MMKESRAVVSWGWEWEEIDCKGLNWNFVGDGYTDYTFFDIN